MTYEIKQIEHNPTIYMVVQKDIPKTKNGEVPKQRNPAPPENVRIALNYFDLDGNVDFAEVKARFRKRMAEYHPDKVAHLGSELKQLAEEKTKAFTVAFDTIKSYFEDSGNGNN